MSTNYDPLYDTVIRTNSVPAYASAAVAAAQQAAAIAAAQNAASAALNAAQAGAVAAGIVAAASAAAQESWRGVTGNIEGYAAYEPSIFDRAASLLSPISSATTSASSSAAQVAKSALQNAGGIGLGALFGSAGTAVLLGAGALVLLVLLRK